jgi:prepilin-type processing-associated H-X9-DG protein
MANASTTGAQAAGARVRNVLWGCPAFEGYKKAAKPGDDTNPSQPGYGMNGFPKMTEDDPNYDGIGQAQEIVADENYIVWSGGKIDPTPGTSGRWFKSTEYTRPAQRGLVADCAFWVWESETAAVDPVNYPPNITNQVAVGASNLWTAQSQTTVDLFRHGKTPSVQGAGINTVYASNGGTIRYNILYCDGHVDSQSTAPEAYRACRQRFPN